MTGERIDSKEACAIGFCQEELPTKEAAMDRAFALAQKVAQNSPTAVARINALCSLLLEEEQIYVKDLKHKHTSIAYILEKHAIGRAHFGSKEPTPWGPFKPFSPIIQEKPFVHFCFKCVCFFGMFIFPLRNNIYLI